MARTAKRVKEKRIYRVRSSPRVTDGLTCAVDDSGGYVSKRDSPRVTDGTPTAAPINGRAGRRAPTWRCTGDDTCDIITVVVAGRTESIPNRTKTARANGMTNDIIYSTAARRDETRSGHGRRTACGVRATTTDGCPSVHAVTIVFVAVVSPPPPDRACRPRTDEGGSRRYRSARGSRLRACIGPGWCLRARGSFPDSATLRACAPPPLCSAAAEWVRLGFYPDFFYPEDCPEDAETQYVLKISFPRRGIWLYHTIGLGKFVFNRCWNWRKKEKKLTSFPMIKLIGRADRVRLRRIITLYQLYRQLQCVKYSFKTC